MDTDAHAPAPDALPERHLPYLRVLDYLLCLFCHSFTLTRNARL
jgi:hypothetical protein